LTPAVRSAALGAVAVICCIRPVLAAGLADAMVELTLQGQRIEGSPIGVGDKEAHLLGRDGRLWAFQPEAARDYRKTVGHFRAYSTSEFRAALLRELGGGYEVTGTGHYLIAHPRGQGEKWAQRFEDLYRSLVHYFSVRGLQPAPPQFPLVGIVCRNHDDFARHAAASGQPAPNGVAGYYNPDTNRITLYDMGGKADSQHWRENAGVLIHEATHQTAFNSGVHSRYALPPKWLAEGLAMLFEAPGVYDSRAFPQLSDRINRARLRTFREAVRPRHRPELLAAVVASDDFFNANPGAAYAEAWALTFFLAETEPAKYVRYLKLTAARPPFAEYSRADRLKDFAAIFGGDWRMLEARFLRFVESISSAQPSPPDRPF
jgi:hypothetical protein